MIVILLPFIFSLVFSIIFVPVVREYSLRSGHVSSPRIDRWNRNPIATLGGIAIFISFILTLVILDVIGRISSIDVIEFNIQWNLLLGSAAIFLLGLYDDYKELSPPAKLIGQILAAAFIIYNGYTTQFFTPRIENEVLAQLPNIILTFIWIIGLTNAINLIDNMDGLAGGIALIGALFLSFFFYKAQNINLSLVSMTIAGSVLGYLIYNFPPASIFMGDSGSLFLGFTLAVLAIARQPQASNVLAVMGVPILIFMIPIIDTGMVFFTRILRGDSPIKGGKDHTSHRLVAFGFSEKKVLLILYSVAIFSGLVAAQLESIRYWYSLVLVPILIVSFTLFVSFLGGMKVVEAQDNQKPGRTISKIIGELTYRRKLLEIIFDFFLIGIAYYLAFLFRFNLNMNDDRLGLFINTLPIALFGVYLSFIIFGIYKLIWKYASIEDLWRYLQASVGGVIIVGLLLTFLYPEGTFSPRFFIFFFFFLITGLVGSRFSFRVFQMFSTHQSKPEALNFVIYGTGESGELTMQWSMKNLHLKYRLIGFIDDDATMSGRQIHGLPVLGSLDQLPELIQQKKISGIVISPIYCNDDRLLSKLSDICEKNQCWVKKLHIELVD